MLFEFIMLSRFLSYFQVRILLTEVTSYGSFLPILTLGIEIR